MVPRRSFFLFSLLVWLMISLGWSPSLRANGMAAEPATPTAKPTNTFRNLLTPNPTRKATPTVTFTPSPSPTPTRTPIPSGELGAWVDEQVDLNRFLPEQPFVIHFNLPMDPNSALGPAVLTYPYLPGKLSWNENYTTLTFQPNDGFQPGQSYRVYLDHDLQSETQKTFSGIQSWRIAILSAPSMTGYTPQILELTDRLPLVSLRFNREMDPDSVAQALAIDPPVEYDLRWVGEKLEIAIREPLRLGAHYRFTLSERARDGLGVRLDDTYSWSYRIAPVRAAVESKDATLVDFTFNYPLADQNQQVSINIDPPLKGQWTWVSKQLLRFKSETLIPTGQEYTFTFTEDLKDLEGSPVAGLEPLVFTPQSPVQSVLPDPAAGAWDQSYERVVISFNRPIDASSLVAAFRIQPEVQGKFSWSKSQRTVEFRPDEPLKAGTSYTVTLAASLKHPGGQPAMLTPYSWSFTTREDYSAYKLNFGEYGANAQVIDADGRRAIQFTGSTNDNSQGIFTLYRMDLGQFVTLYREHFGKSRWGEQTLIDTGDLEKFSSWPHNVTEQGIQETLLPSDAPPGLYLLTASQDGAVQDELFVLITHNTLTVKLSGTRLWVWASDINGESVADLEVRLYMEDGSIMREGSTNEEGIFSTTLPKDLKPLLVVARGEDEDLTASGMTYFWQGQPSNYWWGEPAAPAPQGEYRAYIYTERPIYKPGQLVNFKAIVRKDDDVRYSILPKDTTVQVTIHDARDNQLQAMEMTLSEFGTLNGEFRLAEGAMLGDYAVKVAIGRETFRQAFKVQDYHKPDFQVQLKLDKEFYAQGEGAKVEVDAQYFFGEPVVNASLKYTVYTLQPAGYDWWWQDIQVGAAVQKGSDYIWHPSSGDWGIKSRLPTDENGQSVQTIRMDPESFYNCRSSWRSSLKECIMAIEVTANDGSNQTVSASKIIKVYNAPEAYTLEAGDWRKRPGETFEVTAAVLLLDGKPAPDREIELAVLGQGDYYNYYNYDQVISSYSLKTGPDGQVVQPISIDEPGYYRLRLTAPKVGDEYQLEVSDWIYISDKNSNWLREEEDSIEFNITADRTEYKPYEKARFLIASSFSGPALITFERGRVIHTKPVVLTAPLTEIETEIIPEDAPNIYVVINAYEATKNQWEPPKEGEEFYYASSLASSHLRTDQVELHVDASAKALKVTIEPDQERYEPRQEAVFTIKVTDWQDQPVSAELSAALVDEAIFSLSEDLSGDIFNGFYGRRPHTVKTYNSLALSRILYDAGGRGGGGGDMLPTSPRSNFPDTAAWFPVIQTDENGEARLVVPLPDTLTSWRLTVKAVTASTRVGEASTNVTTQKEVQVRPLLPESLAVGDQAELSAAIHNYSDQTRDLTVALESDHLALDGDAEQTLTLKPGESRLVRWRVHPLKPGEGQVTIRVSSSAGEEDAVQLPLPVHLRVIPDVVSESGDFDRMLTTVLVRPDDALPQSMVELKVSRSIAGSVLDGLEYLTGYPYGCVEQTMSRALPNAVVGRAMAHLGISNPALEKQLPELIGAGLQRLYGYQHTDGGWGWWFDDASDAYQSAWVVYGLSMTADAGQPVEPKVIARGAEYLKKVLAQEDQLDLRTQAYLLYALAVSGHGDRDRTLAMAEQPDELDSFSQAALALALDRLGEDGQARAMLEVLDATVVREDGEAKWVSMHGDGHYHDKTMSSTIRSSAMALAAYIQIDPHNRRVSEIVTFLMGRRRVDGWGTTNETAYTVMALTDYLLSQQQSEGDAAYTVLLNGEEISSGVLQPGDRPAQIQIPSEQMKRGTNLLEIRREGEPDGRLYYGISSRMYSDSPSVGAAGAVEVQREYLDKQGKPLATILPGQLVKVRLTVQIPRERASYVMVEDHLPAGLEALNEGLNTTSHEPGNLEYDDRTGEYRSPQTWQKYGYNNKEIRDGRVTFFVTDLEPGSRKTVTFVYLARAVSAGTFTALPAEVQAMYDETLWGRSSSDVLVIEAGEAE